jgi:predicted RNA-binding protein YlqC (UPF0109 family)
MTARDYIEKIVKGIVDYPQDVIVEEKDEDSKIVITVSTHSEDIGKVIGKEGRTVKAINYLLSLYETQKGGHYILRMKK